MANIYSLKTGLASDTTVWSSGTVPVIGDRVLISNGHVVTLDGTYEWGDDSTSTVVINTVSTTSSIFIEGTLYASRTVNSQLTANGNIQVNSRAGVVGFYDCGTAADPIPDGVTHTCILNKSAALANGKYGLALTSSGTFQGRFSSHGKTVKRNTTILSALAIGATSVVVEDATGWSIGDQIVFAPTTTYTAEDVRTILTITAGTGTQATITFEALTYAHLINCPVGNLTSNIVFKPFSTAGSGWTTVLLLAQTSTTATTAGLIHCSYTRFEGMGGSSSDTLKFGMLNVYGGGSWTPIGTNQVIDDMVGLAFYSVGSGSYNAEQFAKYGTKQRTNAIDIAIYGTRGNATASRSVNSSDWTDTVIYRCGSAGWSSNYSQGSVNNRWYNCKFFGITGTAHSYTPGFAPEFYNCTWGPCNATLINPSQSSSHVYDSCDFGYTFGKGPSLFIFNGAGYQSTASVVATNCYVAAGLATRPQTFYQSLGTYIVNYVNLNNDVLQQEIHRASGSIYRDNSVYRSGTSSIRIQPDILSLNVCSNTISIVAPNNTQRIVVGYLRKNSSYGASTLPSVTLSGLGITPQTFTMTNSVDTWEKFTLTATQTSGADGNLTLTYSAQSANSGAIAYFDGVTYLPFVTTTRNFGYLFDNNPYATPDPTITVSEATALAYPVTVDSAAQTITVTASATNAEVYQACIAFLCQTENLNTPVFITSEDGSNFTTTYTVVNISNVSGTFTHALGTVTYITAPYLLSGTRVQLYNVTDSMELLNTTLAGAGVSYQITYTEAKTIRLRAALVDTLPITAFGVLSSAGVTYIDVQTADTVYIANAINGSTVTEFTPDGPNLQVDINDADNTTQVQRLYAWFQYYATTSSGVASIFFNAITASDTANYVIDQAQADVRLDNTKTTPLIVTGGYLIRKDYSTVIAATSNSIQMDPGRAYLADTASLALETTAQSTLTAARLAAALSA